MNAQLQQQKNAKCNMQITKRKPLFIQDGNARCGRRPSRIMLLENSLSFFFSVIFRSLHLNSSLPPPIRVLQNPSPLKVEGTPAFIEAGEEQIWIKWPSQQNFLYPGSCTSRVVGRLEFQRLTQDTASNALSLLHSIFLSRLRLEPRFQHLIAPRSCFGNQACSITVVFTFCTSILLPRPISIFLCHFFFNQSL